MSSYTAPAHIARATLEANAFMTRAVAESMKLDSGADLPQLKVCLMPPFQPFPTFTDLNSAGRRRHDQR